MRGARFSAVRDQWALDPEEGPNESCRRVSPAAALGGDGTCGAELESVSSRWGSVVPGGAGLLRAASAASWPLSDGAIECCSFVGETDGSRRVCVGSEGSIDTFMKVSGRSE